MKIENKSFKNKEASIYIDITFTDGKYNLYVYDFILLRDVYSKQGLSKNDLQIELKNAKEKHNCFIEV